MKEMTVDIINKKNIMKEKSYTIRPPSYKKAAGPAYTQRALTRPQWDDIEHFINKNIGTSRNIFFKLHLQGIQYLNSHVLQS